MRKRTGFPAAFAMMTALGVSPAPPAPPAPPTPLTAGAREAEATRPQAPDDAHSVRELVGLWEGRLRFGPDEAGKLTLALPSDASAGAPRADLAGRSVGVQRDGAILAFSLPDDLGSFRGRLHRERSEVRGFWTQPPTIVGGGQRYASPVVLTEIAPGLYRGDVEPLEDRLTFFLNVDPDGETGVSAFLRNPERNLGRFLRVTRLAREGRDGEDVDLVGRPFGAEQEKVISRGAFDDIDQRLRIFIPWHGDFYDLTRADQRSDSGFFPRGKNPVPYRYRPPPALADGWPVATLEAAGLARVEIERFVQQLIDQPIDSVSSPEIHGVLIARHGNLVLEEYFHGFHRDRPHDTRSASKVLASTLAGAAIRGGAPLQADSRVYQIMQVMPGGSFPGDLEQRQRELTVEHLLTMSSGLECDDRDDQSPGNEDTMQQQSAEPDWYRYTLDLAMVRDPGAESVYCSAGANLLGGVLQRATGETLPEMFDQWIARPLGISRYHLPLTPTGDAYMGGGAYFLPRDFMKLAQVMLDGGVWRGERILDATWAARAASPLRELSGIQYGYLWWSMEWPWRGGTVRGFFAGGNGGQIVAGIPELGLVIAIYGGNYSDPVMFKTQRELVPQSILPAVNALPAPAR